MLKKKTYKNIEKYLRSILVFICSFVAIFLFLTHYLILSNSAKDKTR